MTPFVQHSRSYANSMISSRDASCESFGSVGEVVSLTGKAPESKTMGRYSSRRLARFLACSKTDRLAS